MVDFIYATSNVAKLRSMREVLAPLDINIIGLQDTSISIPEPQETGSTPLENARIKAKAYYEVLKRPLFSCDSGLYLGGLDESEQPGVHIRSIGGKYMNDDEMVIYYSNLARKLGGKATARYMNGICLVLGDEEVYEHFGNDISGNPFLIVDTPHPKRVEGFPLDCLSVHIESGEYYYDYERPNGDMGIVFSGFQKFFQKIQEKWE